MLRLWSAIYGLFNLPTAIPGSELAVWTNSLPWCLTTQLGSICVFPLGSKCTIWKFLKSVILIALLSGHMSKMSGMLSLSKSSWQSSPRPSPIKVRFCQCIVNLCELDNDKSKNFNKLKWNSWINYTNQKKKRKKEKSAMSQNHNQSRAWYYVR